MNDVLTQPDEIERRRQERAYRLAVFDIPILRLTGMAFVSLAVYLNNRFLVPELGLWTVGTVTTILLSYSVISWIVLRVFYQRFLPFDLGLVFLVLDVIFWTGAIYASGGEKSWMFFILIMRVADQCHTTFRRCIAFGAFCLFCYAAMMGWIHFVDGRPIDAGLFLAKLVFVAIPMLYIALTARTAEARRARLTSAVRMSRNLIRQMEEQSTELRDASQRARDASAAKSEFLANMSHEMRTPLHGVLGMLQLAMDGETSLGRTRQLEMARRSAEALLHTIDEVLDFAKLEARRLDLEESRFSLRDLLADTMKTLGVTGAAKGLALSYLVREDVPDVIRTDSVRLRQILTNLVGNAIKFTPSGSVALRVSLQSQKEKAVIRFEVKDTGIGISAEKQRRIFDPFTQADSSHSRRFGGTGLGLSIVARVVEAMEGEISVSSEEGKGSTFVFTITVNVEVPHVPSSRRSWENSLIGARILVVEPYEASREAIAYVLGCHAVDVTAVRSFDEAPDKSWACVVAADRHPGDQPMVRITSPLESGLEGDITVSRPVGERELLEAVALAFGRLKFVEKSAVRPAPRRQRPLRVLVAEDNLVNQEFAAEALRRLGHAVLVASDGAEALALMTKQEFDTVLMDIQMPKLDGLEVTERFRAIEGARGEHRVRIIALTAHTSQEDRERCLEAGMDSVLTKPIDAMELAAVLGDPPDTDAILEYVGGNVALLARVSEAFSRQTPALIAAMRDSVTRGDAEALYRAAHKLKGSVSNFPSDPANDLARRLENAARNGDLSNADDLVQNLDAAVSDLMKRIEAALVV